MKLNLQRPLVIFDLETTGTNVGHDRIVEMCFLKVMPDGSIIERNYRVRPTDQYGNTIHIPEQATAVHHITDADVADKPSFKDLSNEVKQFIGDSDIAGFNSNKFDVPMLAEEMLRAGTSFDIREHRLIDVQNIFHRMEPRTLRAAYRFYCGGADFENAHSANADTRATYEVLLAQIERYQGVDCDDKGNIIKNPIRNDIQALSDFSTIQRHADLVGHFGYNKDGKEVFNFGKHKDKTLEEVFTVEPSYAAWMCNADFPETTKLVVREVMDRLKLQKVANHLNGGR